MTGPAALDLTDLRGGGVPIVKVGEVWRLGGGPERGMKEVWRREWGRMSMLIPLVLWPDWSDL